MTGPCDVSVVAGLPLGKRVEFATETKFQAWTVNPFLRSRAYEASATIWFYWCKWMRTHPGLVMSVVCHKDDICHEVGLC